MAFVPEHTGVIYQTISAADWQDESSTPQSSGPIYISVDETIEAANDSDYVSNFVVYEGGVGNKDYLSFGWSAIGEGAAGTGLVVRVRSFASNDWGNTVWTRAELMTFDEAVFAQSPVNQSSILTSSIADYYMEIPLTAAAANSIETSGFCTRLSFTADNDATSSEQVFVYTWDLVTAGVQDATIFTNSGNPVNLFIAGHETTSNTMTLHELSFLTETSGNTMFTLGHLAENSSIPLYTHGPTFHSSSGTLFIGGLIKDSGNIPLFIRGGIADDMALFIHGLADDSGNISMFTQGHIASSSGMSLYITSAFDASYSINLFLEGVHPPYHSGQIPLFMWATAAGTTGIFKTPTLFVHGNESNPTGIMNLWVQGYQPPEAYTNTMYLFLKGLGNESGFQSIVSNIPFVVFNEWELDSSGLSLLMYNQQAGTSGYTPVTGTMPLYISRGSESISHNLPMFVNGPSGYNEEMTLFMQGLPNYRDNTTLYIFGVGNNTTNIRLYTNGF